MDIETINKIKSNISTKFAELFTKEELETNRFVPVNKQSGFLFIVISDGANKQDISKFVATKCEDSLKFITIDNGNFEDLFSYYISLCYSDKTKGADTVSFAHNDEQQVIITTNDINSEQHNQGQTSTEKKSFEFNHDDNAPKKKIGEILIENGMITEEQLLEALTQCKKTGTPIGSMLVTLGFITVDQLKDALSYQQGYQHVTSAQLNISEGVVKILPEDFIKENKVFPLSSDGRFLDVGMVNPDNKKALNEIIYLTGLKPRVLLMSYMEFKNCINKYFGRARKETKEIIRKIEQEALEFEVEESLWEQVERELEDTSGSVASFATKIITDAIDMKASDIHIEPRLDCYTVRYRVDGILRRVLDLPSKVESSLIARFKVLSRMNIAEHRRTQDGTFTVKYNGISYDFRINTLPVAGKEKMVIRILAPAASIKTEDKVIKLAGGTEDDLSRINKMVAAPNGIILAVGPTGSGKTTTLYSILKSLNNEGVNITTLEDPVEIKIDGLNQSQINPKAGITFASCMKAILRQDPDIILIGEIRDFETLETAIAAALTGHLVLSTLHTNSAAATITRLIQMGAADYLISSTLTGIIAQRLVRRLCPKCKEAYHPTLEEAQLVVATPEEQQEFMKRTVYRPKGCFECNNEGYKGRLGCYEVMLINKEIKKMIAHSAHDVELEEAAVGMGMKTLQTSCLGHILRGETTISEFVRVLGPVSE